MRSTLVWDVEFGIFDSFGSAPRSFAERRLVYQQIAELFGSVPQ